MKTHNICWLLWLIVDMMAVTASILPEGSRPIYTLPMDSDPLHLWVLLT